MSKTNRFQLSPLVWACLSLWGSGSALAQTEFVQQPERAARTAVKTAAVLSPIVVTATQREQEIREAPASITVISREEIAEKPYSAVIDVLRSVEGLNIIGSSPNAQDISIRGMPGEYTLILVDGKRRNTRETMNRSSSGVQGHLLPPLSAIERIEVVRGPMSSLYGADAMGGVVNIITRKVPTQWRGELNAGVDIQQEKNQGDYRRMRFWLGGPIKADVLGLQIAGSALRRDEDDIYYLKSRTNGIYGRRMGNVDIKLTAKPASNQDVSFNIGREQLTYLSTPGKSVPPLTQRTLKRQRVKTKHSRDYWGLTHKERWDFGSSTLALYGESGEQQEWLSTRQLTSSPRIRNTVVEAQVAMPWGSDKNLLTAGGQYTLAQLDDVAKQDAVPKNYNQNPDTVRRRSWALFGENDHYVNPALVLTTGLRLDHDEYYGSHVSPRLYGVYYLNQAWVVRGGISSGFKAPTLRQSTRDYCMTTGGAAGAVRGTLCGNPDLRPETNLTQEFGIRYDSGKDSVALTLFNNRFKNKVSSYDTGKRDPHSPGRNIYQYHNISRVKLYGLELAGQKQLMPGVGISAGYTLTFSRRQSSEEKAFNGTSLKGLPLDKTPKHKLTAELDWRVSPQLSLYANAHYVSKQYWAAFRNGAAGVRTRPGSTTFDFGGQWQVSKWVDIDFALLNLSNKRVTVDERGRFHGLSGNWSVDEGRRFVVDMTARF